jgi:F-type H+-transporting ATPase subunit delta
MSSPQPNVPPTNGVPPQPRVADVSSQRIARVYAEALLDAAADAGAEDAVLEEFRELVLEAFHEQPEFERFLSSLAVGRDRKAAIIDKVLGEHASPHFRNFLQVLNDHDRLDLLRTIYFACVALREQRNGLMRVQVRSAVPLADEQHNRLTAQLRQLFGREPIVEAVVDPDLLGGLVVQVGDWLYDGSVRTQFIKIRNQLFESASHAIQSRRDRFSSD